MRVLITGGAGFIGSHLAETLLAQGDEVYIIDDLSTGSMDNIAPLQANPSFRDRLFVQIDSVLKKEPMLELIGTCDAVYHMAAAVGVRTILDKPLISMRTNIQGTELVLELCNKFKKKVLIASTSEVYGKHNHAPLVEDDNIIYGPSQKFRWSYAASKLMDEFIALAYHRTHGLPVVVARFFNTVGPRQTGAYGMVIPRFIEQALANEPITVYGDGSQTRTFTYVRDAVWALPRLMVKPDAIGEVINIGGNEEISIKALAEKIIELTGSSSTIETIPYDRAFGKDFEDMQRRVPGLTKIRDMIGYDPKTQLNDILKKTIADVKERHA